MKSLNFILVIILLIFGASSLLHAQSSTKYSVYCASGKIEVDMRSLEQMKSARGSDVCQFGQFDYLSDAQSFAKKNFGGVGASCSCK